MPKIFISYRRADSTTLTGRLYDSLVNYWGQDSVFYDVASIAPGTDFPHELRAKIADSDVMLVVIGPQWATVTHPNGEPRLHDPADYVRREVEQGLRDCKRVIPILLDGAQMPSSASLPETLRPLAHRNAFIIDDEPRFRYDVERFIKELDGLLAQDVRGYRSPMNERKAPGPMASIRNWLLLATAIILVVAVLFIVRALTLQSAFYNPPAALEPGMLLRMELAGNEPQDEIGRAHV